MNKSVRADWPRAVTGRMVIGEFSAPEPAYERIERQVRAEVAKAWEVPEDELVFRRHDAWVGYPPLGPRERVAYVTMAYQPASLGALQPAEPSRG